MFLLYVYICASLTIGCPFLYKYNSTCDKNHVRTVSLGQMLETDTDLGKYWLYIID